MGYFPCNINKYFNNNTYLLSIKSKIFLFYFICKTGANSCMSEKEEEVEKEVKSALSLKRWLFML